MHHRKNSEERIHKIIRYSFLKNIILNKPIYKITNDKSATTIISLTDHSIQNIHAVHTLELIIIFCQTAFKKNNKNK